MAKSARQRDSFGFSSERVLADLLPTGLSKIIESLWTLDLISSFFNLLNFKPRATFSKTELFRSNGSWKTTRHYDATKPDQPCFQPAVPENKFCPVGVFNNPASIKSKVDLPAPLGPISASILPCGTWNSGISIRLRRRVQYYIFYLIRISEFNPRLLPLLYLCEHEINEKSQ